VSNTGNISRVLASMQSTLATMMSSLSLHTTPTLSLQGLRQMLIDNDRFYIFTFNITTSSAADAALIANSTTDSLLDTDFVNNGIPIVTRVYGGGNLFSVSVGCNQPQNISFTTYHKQICDNCCSETCRSTSLLELVCILVQFPFFAI
jgi:hypothetical protein